MYNFRSCNDLTDDLFRLKSSIRNDLTVHIFESTFVYKDYRCIVVKKGGKEKERDCIVIVLYKVQGEAERKIKLESYSRSIHARDVYQSLSLTLQCPEPGLTF